jgi:hypothetical protein
LLQLFASCLEENGEEFHTSCIDIIATADFNTTSNTTTTTTTTNNNNNNNIPGKHEIKEPQKTAVL